MKNAFNFQRFLRVLRLSWQTQPVLPYIVLVAGIPIMYLILSMEARSPFVSLRSDTPFLVFNTYFWICGWLYAGLIFSELEKSGTATRYLMIPASNLEKWLAKSLLAVLVFPLITWLTFNLAFKGFEILSLRSFAFRYPDIDWLSKDMFISFFTFYLALPAAYASGLSWKRFGILKGFIFVFVLLIILYYILQAGFEQFPYDSGQGVLLQEVKLPFLEQDSNAANQTSISLFWLLAAYVPSLLLLASTYFFIREKEI
jgi:hypothetical protein